jgi:hypothetical protein
MSRAALASVAHAFRRAALPLASYYAVTLAVPFANGAAQSAAFAAHALVVLIVPPVAILLACATRALVNRLMPGSTKHIRHRAMAMPVRPAPPEV